MNFFFGDDGPADKKGGLLQKQCLPKAPTLPT
jgi:hypothetical protein